MGQHNRVITCVDCPAVIMLRLARAKWHALAGSGRTDHRTRWRCSECERRRTAPKVSNFERIKLPVREPHAGNVARLAELTPPARPAGDERLRGQLFGERSTVPTQRAGMIRHQSRPMMRASMLLAAVSLLGVGAVAPVKRDAELPALVRDLVDYHRQHAASGAVFVSVSRQELVMLETEPAYVDGLRAHGFTVESVAHPNNSVNVATIKVTRLG